MDDEEIARRMFELPEIQQRMRDAEHARAEGRTMTVRQVRRAMRFRKIKWYLRGLRFVPRMLAAIIGSSTLEETDALIEEIRIYRTWRP